ncbi:type II secretion system ATPase GspE [Pseudobacteriovorax antillogorgiicola]|uniref:protein-secreting ATPase n=1 Tax=Pseudobacteriovorax antillogorgiicola TaxID=1513793 RepID=A0A1Y6B6U0_9BACT|nr:type II secretion system ATPase GspE [Pseudobacteriovorax antillogorgiicola]TCS58716.1 type II secretion system protein E (GspE) [Pseudobacteriovorax antillogorgiicola]SME95438.1 type II secretion system protein E (GspE) [Pseudobacteriovorax antillogorgiicola]
MSDDHNEENEKSEGLSVPKWTSLPTVDFRSLQHKTLGQILIETDRINEKQLVEALNHQQEENNYRKLGEVLVEKEYVSEEEMLKALALQLDLPYYDRLPINDIDPALVDSIPIQFCRDNKILPIARDDFNVTVVVSDPLNIYPLDDLRLILSTNINMIVSPPGVIENSINRVFERANDASQKVLDELNVGEMGADEDLEETRDLLESTDDEKPIIRLVNSILARAVKERASDIHIEPLENEVLVRFRIDGMLQDKTSIPKRHAGSLASRIKIIGKLNIAEKRVPQDGRIPIKVAGKDIDVRLSVLPVSFGERVVMRLLDKSAGGKRLDQMGLENQMYNQLCDLVEQKHGIVLVTGPTGSGKSTLLYASLMHINTTDINILTIEDPVEYQVSGIGQIEVKEKIGMTFASGLRSILRQDPDVIMIGEIRDSETAKIAVQASITGHLVLSTVHTNDTASTVTRFLDFGVQPFQLSSAVLGIVATRLLRKLCAHCHEAYTPSDEELHILGVTRESIEGKTIYRAGPGCEKCFGIGYFGRVGVYELLQFDDEIRNLILKTQDSKSIKKLAVEKGMVTLRDSALQKVVNGETSLEEAIRKTQVDDIEMDVGAEKGS